jgi:hypothetical protein
MKKFMMGNLPRILKTRRISRADIAIAIGTHDDLWNAENGAHFHS